MSSQGIIQSKRLTAEDWKLVDKHIVEWYLVQRRSLSQMQSDAWEKYKFTATARQWKHHLKMLKCKKNKTRQHRKLDQTNSSNAAIQSRGVSVDPQQDDRHMHELEKERRDLSPSTSTPSGLQWDPTISQGSTVPIIREAPDSHMEQSLKAPGSPIGLTTVDMLWALDAAWHELLNGHPADPYGFPLGALAMVLRDKAAQLGISLGPELTLTDVLREVFAKVSKTYRPRISFTKSAEIQDVEWEVDVRTKIINDSLFTIDILVCCEWSRDQTTTRETSYVAIYLRLAHSDRLREACTAIYCTWKGAMSLSSRKIFDVIGSIKDDISTAIEVERVLKEDPAAVLYLQRRYTGLPYEVKLLSRSEFLVNPVEAAAQHCSLATTRLLLERGSPIRSHFNCTSIVWNIWAGFSRRWQDRFRVVGGSTAFEGDFARCKDMTSLAIKYGAQIHEDILFDENIHFDDDERSILWLVTTIDHLQPHQLGQVLKYLLSFGLDIEHRNGLGQTPLLFASGYGGRGTLSALLDAGADLYAKDDSGQGYLHVILTRLLEDEYLELKERATLRKNLTILLKVDRRFSEQPITPKETPLISSLARSEEDWDLWMSVFKRLDWNTVDMETYRYRALLTYPGEILAHGDQKPRLLEQARWRIGKRRARKISSAVAKEKGLESDESEADVESDSSDEAEESDESGDPRDSEQFGTTASQ